MPEQTISAPSYDEAKDAGNVTHRDGYHDPTDPSRPGWACGCSLDTGKGAHRDVTVEMPDGRTVYFYHQSPVVVKQGRRYRLDSHGYRTNSTKDRINRYLPSGYKVVQRDYEWYLKTWDPAVDYGDRDPDRRDFEDGMVIEA